MSEFRDLMHAAIDDDISADESAELERLLAQDTEARAQYEELRAVAAALQTLPMIDAPAGLQASIRERVQRQPTHNGTTSGSAILHRFRNQIRTRHTNKGTAAMSNQIQESFSRHKVWGVVGALALTVCVVGYLDLGSENSYLIGAIAPAERYQENIISADDVVLGDDDITQLMQSDTFIAILEDESFAQLMADSRWTSLMADGRMFALMADSHMQALMADSRLQALMADGRLASLMADGHLQALMADGRWASLMADGRIQALMADGLWQSLMADGRLASLMAEGRWLALMADGRLAALMADGRLAALMADGRLAALMADGRLASLVAEGRLSQALQQARVSRARLAQ